MCGIAGQIRFDGQPVERERLLQMTRALAQRGPDGEGLWLKGPVGLGHRRLAIIDLTASGAQPMLSADGRYAIVFNGEIYNYRALRHELEQAGTVFRSSSDTEVLLHLYAREGVGMLERLRGMFAFALWDEGARRLFVARDRYGKKPLYYRQDTQAFSFASEAQALFGLGPRTLDRQALRAFFGLQYVPDPLTGWNELRSLPPGCYGLLHHGAWRIESYYTLRREPKRNISFDEAAHELHRHLDEAVRARLVADVPVGAFLSGGMDSASIVALMQRASAEPIQTFTMGFPAFGADERAQAQALAERLGTRHRAFECTAQQATGLVDTLVETYASPFADSSAVPVWFLARETSRHIKVVLVGDGGDELLGGYRRYQAWLTALAWSRRLFGHTRGPARVARWIGGLRHDPRYARFARVLECLHVSPARGYAAMFSGSYFSLEEEQALLQPDFLAATATACAEQHVLQAFDPALGAEGALEVDFRSYLPYDLNVKMDRASMAHGLEARAPFLDQAVVEFLTRLPVSLILRRGQTKALLQAAMRDLVPAEVWTRPKRGFQVPLSAWFRADLRAAFEERCLAHGARIQAYCRPEAMTRYLAQNDRGTDHGNRLWLLLVLATWLEKNL